MRKLLLITTILVAATSAHATQTRGLLVPASNIQTAQLQVEEQKPSVADQLRAIGEAPKPAATEQVATPAAAPASAPVPQAQPATPSVPQAAAPAAAAPAPSQASETRADAEPAKKPVKKAKAQRRETDEQKARRIAARYGISW